MSNASDYIIKNGVLTKYVGPGGDVIVPEGVTEIGEDAFAVVEQIGTYSFYTANRSLRSISLPEGLKTIGSNAFRDCLYLAKIVFPDTISEIGASAFQGTGLTDICLPKSLKKVGNEAFAALNMWQIIDDEVYSNEQRKSIPHRVKTEGMPKLGKLVFDNSYTTEEYCDNSIPIDFDMPEEIPSFPMLLSWTEIGAYMQKLLLCTVLQEPDRFRSADRIYLANAAKKAQKTLYPEICKRIDERGVTQMCALGMVDAENMDIVLGLFSNRPAERATLLEWAEKHITTENRTAVIEKHTDKQIEKQVKRNKAIDDTLSVYAKKKPAEIKKEWSIVDAEDGVSIAKYKGNDVNIVIPASIGKESVVAIGIDALRAAAGVGEKKNAYQKKIYKTKSIVIEEGIRHIESGAFKGCVYLTDAVLPVSIDRIAETAFEDCHKLTIHAPAGSYAEQYAKEHNIPFAAE